MNLIPHTLAATTFGKVRAGRQVNLEMDVLVKAARGGRGLAAAGCRTRSRRIAGQQDHL